MKIPFSREASVNSIARDGINEIEEIIKINTQEEISYRLINVMQSINSLRDIANEFIKEIEGRKNYEQSTESLN